METTNKAVVSNKIFTIPNVISMLRLVCVPLFAYLIIQHENYWALAILAISGISDWLDGYIARRFNQISKLGQILDPAADRLFIFVTLLGLTYRDVIPLWFAIIVISRDLFLLTLIPALTKKGYGPLSVNLIGKAATFALLYALPLLLLSQMQGLFADIAGILGWAFAWWGAGLYWYAGIVYFIQVNKLPETK